MATPLTDAINALTAYANEITGQSDTDLSDAVYTLADGYGQGTSITDGVIVTTRDSSGRPTAVEKYGNCRYYDFGINSRNFRGFAYGYLESVVLHDCTILGEGVFENSYIQSVTGLEDVTECGNKCFMYSPLASITLPKATHVGEECFRLLGSTCKSVILPVLQTCGNYIFNSSTDLENVQIGSVGHPAPMLDKQPFYGCTQSGLSITAYQTGVNADTLVSYYRRNATNATIIIKASEATTYGGNSYAAGDTILTSTS